MSLLVDFVAEFVRVICTSYSYAGGAVVIVDDVLDAAEANAGVVVQTTVTVVVQTFVTMAHMCIMHLYNFITDSSNLKEIR